MRAQINYVKIHISRSVYPTCTDWFVNGDYYIQGVQGPVLQSRILAVCSDYEHAQNIANEYKLNSLMNTIETALEFVDSGGLGPDVNAHAKATLEQYLKLAISKAGDCK